jgi:hypothetical protein
MRVKNWDKGEVYDSTWKNMNMRKYDYYFTTYYIDKIINRE